MGLKATSARDCGVDIAEIKRKYFVESTQSMERLINKLSFIGVLRMENKKLFFTNRGLFFVEPILLKLMETKCFFSLLASNDDSDDSLLRLTDY